MVNINLWDRVAEINGNFLPNRGNFLPVIAHGRGKFNKPLGTTLSFSFLDLTDSSWVHLLRYANACLESKRNLNNISKFFTFCWIWNSRVINQQSIENLDMYCSPVFFTRKVGSLKNLFCCIKFRPIKFYNVSTYPDFAFRLRKRTLKVRFMRESQTAFYACLGTTPHVCS